MTKAVIVTDTHFGARSDSGIFSNYFAKFYEEVFFPYIDNNDIKYCFHLGDVFDRRKYINYRSLKECKNFFFEPLAKRNIETHIIAGNHDTFYKTTNDVNSVDLLLREYSNVNIYDEVIELNVPHISPNPFVMLPWVCSGNYEQSMNVVKNTKCDVLFGHLEVAGFEAHLGYMHDSGFDKKTFDRFDTVLSGHFHHKSDNGTIYYLGNPYEITWQDYQDQKGFHVFDFETRELEFIHNPFNMFHKYYYNDTELKPIDVQDLDFDQYENRYVKIIIQEKDNPYVFDLVMDKMIKAGAYDINVVENFIDVGLDEEIIDEAEDTITILSQYIDNMSVNVDKKALDGFVKTLYNEALTMD